ncbi:chemoreceptor glutamine deamidase CheD [Thermomonas brevis]|jgi:chemotaxis protein CheD|uniref:Probable chemoreceptor glutamine deamidase CheD n=1 Tax=Thermomonas brevis TaxID=215691 RepID=A0A7G9QT42_9GAMM|nr:chemoreceptor glutamine deamidase CheD [Thermomonas brevis]QNN46517.1 chemoreceptor glutamine deamidase CheD [Thermomonas brevis]
MSVLPSRAAPARSPPPGSYYDPALDADVIKLLPAEWRVTSDEVALATVLGSCVAACIYDASANVGGMNHFMLPDAAPGDGSARYGAHAMELLINGLLKHGAMRQRLQAKVFGGGNVLPGMTLDPIGTRNGNFVLDYLSAERIPILAQDLFGNQPRKVCFFARSGRTLVKRLPAAGEIARVERAYRSQLAQKPVAGSVELF